MRRIPISIILLAMVGCSCGHSISQSMPFRAPCEFAESLAPYCLDVFGDEVHLACYGAEAVKADDGSVVCVWRCAKIEDLYQDVYAVFNPEPVLHLDTLIATGPAGQCD